MAVADLDADDATFTRGDQVIMRGEVVGGGVRYEELQRPLEKVDASRLVDWTLVTLPNHP